MEFNFRNLPYVVKREAFLQMSTLEKICYSLLSEQSKRLIQPLIPQANQIEVRLHDYISLRTDIDAFSIDIRLPDRDQMGPAPIAMPVSVQAKNSPQCRTSHSMNHPEFSVRDWIELLKDLLRCSSINLVFHGQSVKYRRESIVETFRGLEISGLEVVDCSPDTTRWYLDTFPPTKSVRLFRNPYNQDGPFRDLFQREFNFLHLFLSDFLLSDVLLMNSRNIIIDAILTGNEYNQLLKKWIQGWNPGLQTMLMRIKRANVGDNVVQNVLDGIAHKVLPNDYEMRHSGPDGFYWTSVTSVLGAYEIKGNDGRRAAFKIDMIGACFNFKIVVL